MEIQQGVIEGVTGISKSGSAVLVGDVTLSGGANVTLTQSGQNIEIASTDTIGANTALSNLASVAINTDLVGAVAGGMGIRGGSAANDDLILEGTTSATRTTSYVILQPNGGNVGIGTTTPSGKLAVSGGASIGADYNFAPPTNGLIIQGNVGIGTTGPLGKFEVSGGVGRYIRVGATGFGLTLKTNDNSIQSQLTLENTQDATEKGNAILFNMGYGGNSGVVGTTVAGGKIILASEQQWSATASTQDSYMQFQTALNGTLTDQVRITSAGNVGIGTTGPGYKLDVWSADDTNPGIRSIKPSATGARALFGLQNLGYVHWRMGINNYDLYFGAANDTEQLVTFKNTGNVGIGTTGPIDKLEVSGGYIWNTNIADAGLILRTGDTGSNGANIQTNANGDITFTTRVSTTNSEKVRILGNGNVGIGTTTPARLLDLFSTATTTLRIDSNSASKGSCLVMKDRSGVGYSYITVEDGVMTTSTISCE